MRICLLCEGIAPDDPAEVAPTCSHCGVPLLSDAEFHYPIRRGEGDAAHPMLGRRIGGKYRVTGVLGRGGMGTVFRAVHEVSLGVVALKILHPRFARRSEYREALRAEAQKASQVIHDHCARVLDVGEFDEGAIFLAMELAEGETLADWLGHCRPDAATAVEILRQIARALRVAHAQGLVHGDLSARNVMLSVRDGQPWVKVLDFGIARGGVTRGDDSLSPKGEVAGFANPAYAAPEQLAGLAIDARADLYSLGVLAHEMLTGRVPVEGRTTREVSQALARGALEPLPRLRGVPRRLRRLVDALLERDPAHRPASAGEVVDELEGIQQPGGRLLAAVSLVAGVGAVAFAAAAAASRPEAFLAARPGAGLILAARIGGAETPQILRSARIDRLDLAYGGFDPARLTVECVRRGATLWTRTLAPQEAGPGVLRLAGRDWKAAVELLAASCADEPVDLQFAVPGREPLGQARVLVDDDPPELELELRGVDGGLVAASDFRLGIGDRSGISGAALELAVAAGEPESFAVAPRSVDTWTSLATLLGGRFPGVEARGRVRLRATARDLAGNVAETEWADLPEFDLRCPAIEEVRGLGSSATVVHDGVTAALRVRVSRLEPGLIVELRSPSGQVVVDRAPSQLGDALEVRWHREEAGFEDGEWVVWLVDEAGNRSDEARQGLAFQRRTVEAELEVAGSTEAGWVGERLALRAGFAGGADLRCGTLWEPQAARFERADGRAVDVRLADVAAGVARLHWTALDAGLWTLRIELRGAGSEDRAPADLLALRESAAFSVMVLPAPCSVRIPDSRELRFLSRVLDRDVLALDGEGLRRGRAWIVDPPFEGAVRMVPWVEEPDGWKVVASGGAAPIPLRRGWQKAAFEFVDALGAPVRVEGGLDQPIELPGGRTLHAVAEFGYHDAAPSVVYPEVEVEYGQAARVVVLSPLALDYVDRPELSLGQQRVSVREIRPAAGGAVELVFDVPFAVIERAAGLTGVGRPAYAQGIRKSGITARLRTPAGDENLSFDVRTSRSLLPVVGLAAVCGPEVGARLGALAELTWIPLPAPDEPFADPVPAMMGAAERARFRCLPELTVRNLGEIYLMADEMTRAPYEVIRGFAVDADLPRADLVHALDPMGEARISAEGLRPRGWDEAAWRAAVAAEPDRSVVSLDAWQAHAAARLLGWVALGDEAAFRLPLGVELERAVAIGRGEGADPGIAPMGYPWQRRHASWAARRAAGDWPPRVEDLVAVGDVLAVPGGRFTGLQFGVCEWVADLPFGVDRGQRALLLEWLQDAGRHLEEIDRLARGERPGDPLGSWFERMAVVRGQALGSDDGALFVSGQPCFPGALRALNLRRDGRDPVQDRLDRRLAEVGFRLVGSGPFLEAVRRR